MAVDIALPERSEDQREVTKPSEQLRAVHPMVAIENCASQSELDFLIRFFEAADFADGHCRVYDDAGEPFGRYADHAQRIDAQSYIKFEIQAYQWVRRFGLGQEWGTIAELAMRMLSGRTETSFIDWGSFLTNADDEKVAYGGAQVSMRMLGLRLKDAYRDFFRFYKTMRDEAKNGKELSPREALREVERDAMYSDWIGEFKRNRGLAPG